MPTPPYPPGYVASFENHLANGNLNALRGGDFIENYTTAIANGYEPPPEVVAAILALEGEELDGLEALFEQLQTPVIAGGATASYTIDENTTEVATISASDPQDDTLTFSISGGEDAAFFSIDPDTGKLSFNSAPDFETALDAGGDNTYDVTVQVSDGTFTDTQEIEVTVEDVAVEYETATLQFLYAGLPVREWLDLETETVFVDNPEDGFIVSPEFDFFIYYDFSVPQTEANALVVQWLNREIAFLDEIPLAELTQSDVAAAYFTTSLIDMPFENDDTILIETDEGNIYALGNPVENGPPTDFSVTFDYFLIA